jgi:hypothetical protein
MEDNGRSCVETHVEGTLIEIQRIRYALTDDIKVRR